MNRLFDPSSAPGFTGREDRLLGVWSPPLDVYQDKDHVFVKVELPGMKKEDIQISLHENTLTISGERKQEREVKEGDGYRSERFFGRFHRSITLPVAVQANNVKAQYKDGILAVSLSKAEEAKPRQIEVQVS
jgi:HSP20 family protein